MGPLDQVVVTHDITGKKAWFMFDELIVALGSNIKSTTPDNIITTINQVFHRGDILVEYGSGQGTAEDGTKTLNNPKWVLHNDVGYLFPEDRTVNLKAAPQSGSWKYIDGESGSSANITDDIFTLYFDHGRSASRSPGQSGWRR